MATLETPRMSDLEVTLPNGHTMQFQQMMSIADIIEANGGYTNCHWHPNECGCCYTVHTPVLDYIVGPDGGRDVFLHGRRIWSEE